MKNNNAYVEVCIGDNHFQYNFGSAVDFDDTTPVTDDEMSPAQVALTIALADAFALAMKYIENYGEMPQDAEEEDDDE